MRSRAPVRMSSPVDGQRDPPGAQSAIPRVGRRRPSRRLPRRDRLHRRRRRRRSRSRWSRATRRDYTSYDRPIRPRPTSSRGSRRSTPADGTRRIEHDFGRDEYVDPRHSTTIDARKAVNFAIDRAHMAELARARALPSPASLLPPSFPGYQPYCPYTLRPDAGGRWKAPDMEAAQRLVDASGTRGQNVIARTDRSADAIGDSSISATSSRSSATRSRLDTRDMRSIRPPTGWDVSDRRS